MEVRRLMTRFFNASLVPTTLTDLDTIGKLAVLEQLLGRERDRVLGQFERRRRERLKHTLEAVAVQTSAGNE
jgi:hypothetical protein